MSPGWSAYGLSLRRSSRPLLLFALFYGRPMVEVTLLLTVLGGMIAWSALSLVAFFRSKRGDAATVDAQRTLVIYRLKRAAF